MDQSTIYLTGLFIVVLIIILVILHKRANYSINDVPKKKKEKHKKKYKNTSYDPSDSSKEVMVTDKIREMDTTVSTDTWDLKKALDAFKIQQDSYINSIHSNTL